MTDKYVNFFSCFSYIKKENMSMKTFPESVLAQLPHTLMVSVSGPGRSPPY